MGRYIKNLESSFRFFDVVFHNINNNCLQMFNERLGCVYDAMYVNFC